MRSRSFPISSGRTAAVSISCLKISSRRSNSLIDRFIARLGIGDIQLAVPPAKSPVAEIDGGDRRAEHGNILERAHGGGHAVEGDDRRDQTERDSGEGAHAAPLPAARGAHVRCFKQDKPDGKTFFRTLALENPTVLLDNIADARHAIAVLVRLCCDGQSVLPERDGVLRYSTTCPLSPCTKSPRMAAK